MSKQQIIDAIRQHNQSAAEHFLGRFEESALLAYLQRLTRVQGQRGPQSVWVRQGGTPAIVGRAA